MWETVSVWQDNVLNYTCKGKKACGRPSLCGMIMSSTTPVKVRWHSSISIKQFIINHFNKCSNLIQTGFGPGLPTNLFHTVLRCLRQNCHQMHVRRQCSSSVCQQCSVVQFIANLEETGSQSATPYVHSTSVCT